MSYNLFNDDPEQRLREGLAAMSDKATQLNEVNKELVAQVVELQEVVTSLTVKLTEALTNRWQTTASVTNTDNYHTRALLTPMLFFLF